MARLRLLWRRGLILGLGIFTVWLIVFVIFRFTDHRLPWILALGVTYGVAAYVVLPRIIRLGVKVLKKTTVPDYTITGDGLPGDPVNLALIGTLAQLKAAFASMGWAEADALGWRSSWGMIRAFVLNKPYPKAPFSTLYLFGRAQDIGFQKPIGDSPRQRHHIRFWSLSASRAQSTLGTPDFWLNTDRAPDGDKALWVGAATRDTGLSLTWLSFQVTHATDPDTMAERDLVISQLAAGKLIDKITRYDDSKDLPAKRLNHYAFDGDVSIATLVT